MPRLPVPGSDVGTWGTILNEFLQVAHDSAGTIKTSAISNASGSGAGLMSSSDKTKLDGVATGATANSPDATLLNRANHTGTQTAATISDFTSASYIAAQTIETVAGTTYNVVAADAGKLKNITNGSAVSVIIPTPTSLGLGAGTRVEFRQGGFGQITFSADTGATVNGTPGLRSRAQYSGVTAIAMSTTEWWLVGDLDI